MCTTSDLRYQPGEGQPIVVRAGRETDFASVPRVLAFLATDWRQSARPAVLHDAGYQDAFWLIDAGDGAARHCTRRQADAIFYEALRVEGASWFKANAMWTAVRLGGRGSWRGYRSPGTART